MTSNVRRTIKKILAEDLKALSLGPIGVWPQTMQPPRERLNPALFDGLEMLPMVREALLRVADDFMSSLKLDKLDLKRPPVVVDVILTGSNANFNYTRESDVDLHIVVDSTSKLMLDFLNRAKNQWNSRRDVWIDGFPVEVYVENPATAKSNSGVYSLTRGEWISPPIKFQDQNAWPFNSNPKVLKIAKNWSKMIDVAVASGDFMKMKDVLFYLRNERSRPLNSGLSVEEAETAPENLAFKLLRRRGHIDMLNDAMDAAKDSSLSLKKESLSELQMPIVGPLAVKVKYHDELNQDIWTSPDPASAKLIPDVRQKSLEIAKEFASFARLPWSTIVDVTVKGSIANFNYSKNSDFDLHLVSTASPEQLEFAEERRVIWREKYSGISINGYPVEVGVEPPGKVHSSSAVYSVLEDEWIDEPIADDEPNRDVKLATLTFRRWKSELRALIREYKRTGSDESLRALKDAEAAVRARRQQVLPGHEDPNKRRKMELDPENVAFKKLRDTGIFDEIKELYNQSKVKKLSLSDRERWSDSVMALIGAG